MPCNHVATSKRPSINRNRASTMELQQPAFGSERAGLCVLIIRSARAGRVFRKAAYCRILIIYLFITHPHTNPRCFVTHCKALPLISAFMLYPLISSTSQGGGNSCLHTYTHTTPPRTKEKAKERPRKKKRQRQITKQQSFHWEGGSKGWGRSTDRPG